MVWLDLFVDYACTDASSFTDSIPEGLPSELAAPLQCAGVTVYSALRDTVKPGQRVGILGIGGLGHLAIQCKCALDRLSETVDD